MPAKPLTPLMTAPPGPTACGSSTCWVGCGGDVVEKTGVAGGIHEGAHDFPVVVPPRACVKTEPGNCRNVNMPPFFKKPSEAVALVMLNPTTIPALFTPLAYALIFPASECATGKSEGMEVSCGVGPIASGNVAVVDA